MFQTHLIPAGSALRVGAFAVLCALAYASTADPAASQEAVGAPTLAAVAVDALDDNRFFTRVGGTVRDDVTYSGLVPGQSYTLAAQLYNMTTQTVEGDAGVLTFTPETAEGTASIELPVPPNRTEFNIDYVVISTLYEGELDAGSLGSATPLVELRDTANLDQTIQVHAIQSISVTAADAEDGDNALPPEGGMIVATVEHVNLVAGYRYTLWGQLLTPSGQSTGIYSSVAEYVPDDKNGSLTMEFTVPDGFEGIRLVPTIGLFHQNRVALNEDGSLTWLPDAPNPVMIASDLSLDAAEQTINIGTPFEDLAATGQAP
jgi:hypothetical protein